MKNIIFDLDGTLLDTSKDIVKAVNSTLTYFKFAKANKDKIIYCTGNGSRELIQCVLNDKQNIDQMVKHYNQTYNEDPLKYTKPYKGIVEMLNALKASGSRLFVISNKPEFLVKKIVDFYFPNIFTHVLGFSQNLRAKPAPDTLNFLSRKYGFSPDECIFIGDSEVDLRFSEIAKIPCFLVSYGFRSFDFLHTISPRSTIFKSVKALETALLSDIND